jgi:hypothetical protein
MWRRHAKLRTACGAGARRSSGPGDQGAQDADTGGRWAAVQRPWRSVHPTTTAGGGPLSCEGRTDHGESRSGAGGRPPDGGPGPASATRRYPGRTSVPAPPGVGAGRRPRTRRGRTGPRDRPGAGGGAGRAGRPDGPPPGSDRRGTRGTGCGAGGYPRPPTAPTTSDQAERALAEAQATLARAYSRLATMGSPGPDIRAGRRLIRAAVGIT